MKMVAIFSKTTTCLSEEFLAKLPQDLLELTLENLEAIPGVSIEKNDDTIFLKGQWHDLVTAYVSLEQCILEKSDSKLDVTECLDQFTHSDHELSPDIDYNFVTVKQEKINVEIESPELNASKDDATQSNKTETVSDEDTEIDECLQETYVGPTARSRRKYPCPRKLVEIKRFKSDPDSKPTGPFQCTKCNYVGKTDKNLDNHVARKHHRPFKCDKCVKRFGFKTDLDRHKIDVHEKSKNYFCNICNKYLKTKTYIDDHMSLHADNYVYHCKTCEKSFSTKQVFAKHMKQKHPTILFEVEDLEDILPDDDSKSQENESLSDQSNSTSDNSKNIMNDSSLDPLYFLNREEKIIHENQLYKITLKEGKNKGRPRLKSYMEQPDDRTEFPCNLCNYIGKKESHLENHIIRSHSQKFICDICQKQFGYNWDLKRHKEQVHAEASYFCHICSKAYKVKKSFDEHLRSHEAGYVKSVFPCTECSKTFSAKQVLDNHVKIKHLGVKQKEKQKYLCQTCGAEFYHKYSYLSHMNKHAGLMPYNCDICGKAFASEHSVKEHQITHKDVREFHCHACPKSFKTSSALGAHVAIHEGKKSYKCSVCGKGFIQKQSLIRHERIHSGYKPFTCALCSRVFTDSATIRKHMILVHKSDPHDWQGDVISDLKKQSELWQGDLTSEPKSEPDFRRKADRERMKEMSEALLTKDSQDKDGDKQLESDHNIAHSSKDNFDRSVRKNSDSTSSQAEEGFCAMNQRPSGTQATDSGSHMSTENLNNIHQQVCSAGVPDVSSHNSSHPGDLKKAEFWRGDAYMEAHRSVDMWIPPGVRQGDTLQGEEMMELKRPAEYWPPGVILDATRNSEYFRGGNIPDPRKQIEFWQGHAVSDQKSGSESMHNQLTTLQNMNFSSQS